MPTVPQFDSVIELQKLAKFKPLLSFFTALNKGRYSAEYSAEYSVRNGRIFGIGRYQFYPYRSFTKFSITYFPRGV